MSNLEVELEHEEGVLYFSYLTLCYSNLRGRLASLKQIYYFFSSVSKKSLTVAENQRKFDLQNGQLHVQIVSSIIKIYRANKQRTYQNSKEAFTSRLC